MEFPGVRGRNRRFPSAGRLAEVSQTGSFTARTIPKQTIGNPAAWLKGEIDARYPFCSDGLSGWIFSLTFAFCCRADHSHIVRHRPRTSHALQLHWGSGTEEIPQHEA